METRQFVFHFGGNVDDGTSIFFGELVAGFALGGVVDFAGTAGGAVGLGAVGATELESGASIIITSGTAAAGFGLVPVRTAVGTVAGERVGVATRLTGELVFIGLVPAGFGETVGAAGGRTTDVLGDLASEDFDLPGVSMRIGTGDCALLGIGIRPVRGLVLSGVRALLLALPEPGRAGLEERRGLLGLDCGVVAFLASRMTR